MSDINFKIIIPVYNSEKWIGGCIESVLNQSYKNWKCIIIDDASTDNTLNVIKGMLTGNSNSGKFKIMHRTSNVGAMENIVYGTTLLCDNDEDVIVIIDGDDKLASNEVLEYLNTVYSDPNIWVTYGSFVDSFGASLCKPLTSSETYRQSGIWCTSHLRTYKYKVWRHIPDSAFRDASGRYYSMSCDIATMIPIVELAGIDRIKFIDKILYLYNNLNPINDFKKNLPLQRLIEKEIRSRPKFNRIVEIDKSLNIVIFSKDRPLQLDLLIRSIKKYFVNYQKNTFNILFLASTNEFMLGYEKVKSKHPDFNFVAQTNFKNDVISLIQNKKYTMFGVDDNVFIDYFDMNCKELSILENDNSILALSLRLSPQINFCYTENKHVSVPTLDKNMVWNWLGCQGDWGYPMSVDMNIFRTVDIVSFVRNEHYSNPNYFEGAMANNPIRSKNKMICFNQHKVLNIPCNRVQNTHSNRSGSVSLSDLNRIFLDGKIISLEDIATVKNNSPHFQVDFIFVKED